MCLNMESGEQEEASSLTIPLIVDEKQEEEEEAGHNIISDRYQKAASGFFNTCFNGLNALSGS